MDRDRFARDPKYRRLMQLRSRAVNAMSMAACLAEESNGYACQADELAADLGVDDRWFNGCPAGVSSAISAGVASGALPSDWMGVAEQPLTPDAPGGAE